MAAVVASGAATAAVSQVSGPKAAPQAAKLHSGHNGLFQSTQAFTAAPVVARQISRAAAPRAMAASIADDRVPDMNKRNIMNLLLVGAIGLPGVGLLGPYAYFFVPPSSGGSGAGLVAKDALGNDVTVSGWKAAHQPGDRSLVQGLKGDPTYLIVDSDGTIANFGVNAVCTHLGCVVPWNVAEQKFMCPCHGSQYNKEGKVVRGPAPLSLALAHADAVDGKIVFSPWVETDFRTGEEPWWK